MNTPLSSVRLLILLLFFAGSAAAQNRYVNADGVCGGNVPCYTTISAAVAAASPNDVISVAAGIYPEHVVINIPLTLKGAQMGTPGGAHAGPESIVDGTFTGSPFTVSASNVTIDGFRIINGQNGNNAGVSMGASTSSVQIINNVIAGNSIGVYANSSGSSLIQYNLFDANNLSGPAGGSGIYSEATNSLQVLNNELKNHTQNNPVIFAANGGNAHNNLQFSANSLHDNEYGLFALALNGATFSNNTFRTAAATDFSLGGGSSNVSITNNFINGSFRGVRVADLGYGFGPNSGVAIHNNSFSGTFVNEAILVPPGGHTGTLNAECNWYGTISSAAIAADISGDVDYTSYITNGTDANPSAAGFQPVAGSCNSEAADCSSKGQAKVVVCHNGNSLCVSYNALNQHLAHGDVVGPCTTPAVAKQTPVADLAAAVQFGFSSSPNPFNQNTRVQYMLPAAANVSIRLYDLAGREVSLLFTGNRPAGIHTLDYNASKLSTGVYYCRMVASYATGNYSQTQKLVKIF